MNNWKKCKLGDIAEVVGGGTPSTKVDEYWNGDIAWITPKDLTSYNKVFISKGARSITKLGLSQSSAKLMPKGTVLLTSRAPIGYIAIAENEISTNQGFKSLIPKENLTTSKFLYYWLKNNVEYLKNLSVGTTFAEISGQIVKEVEILLPPLEEQRQIADILSSIDDKIELLHEQNKTLEELAQTLFRHYFIENPNPSWQNVKLGDLVEETIGGEWGKENPIEDFKVPTYCFRGADIADLIAGLPKKIPLRYIKKAKLEKIEPKSGDILLEISGGTETQSTGRAVYIDDNIKKLFNYPIVFSNFCRLLRAKKIEYSYYLFFYLKHLYDNDEFFAFENGSSGIKNLDYKTLLNNTDCLKPDDEIFSFHKKVILYFNKINKNKQQIQTLENMRDILIPKLLNGEIKVGGNQ
ncbi:restriction endonuclease subunit S [Campylobacter coli]|uniref:restriction endonuclease subunit S n=1 Tax=Campylobacter coli TaxID=195 RepID=UPI00092FC9F4|nr:restriction endonuclease subunit S [Campylobacter coli]